MSATTTSPYEALSRYREISGDHDAFLEAACRALPVCFWLNAHRFPASSASSHLAGDGNRFPASSASSRLAWDGHRFPASSASSHLAVDGLSATALPWFDRGFCLVDPGVSFGNSLLYRAGALHVQEAASMIPALVLAPGQGETVLDLCAAPGNKTAQLAIMVGSRGRVVANDSSSSRLGVLRATVERLGLTNVDVRMGDGRKPAWPSGLFDAVLVDAPCSCEGTVRKNKRAPERTTDRAYLVRLQRSLLDQAIRACRPGGRIVYSTCTFAPEENEAVIQHALERRGDIVQIEPVSLEGLETAPGLTSWNGVPFHPSIRDSLRIWPHQNDTGGFYVCALRKSCAPVAALDHPKSAQKAPWLQFEELDPRIRDMLDYFGVSDDALAPYYFKVSGRYLDVSSGVPPLEGLDASGIRLAKLDRRAPAPTTAGALFLTRYASKRRLDVGRAEALKYMNRLPVRIPEPAFPRGPVLVSAGGFPLGHGLYDGNRTLTSQYPRNWAGLNPPRLASGTDE